MCGGGPRQEDQRFKVGFGVKCLSSAIAPLTEEPLVALEDSVKRQLESPCMVMTARPCRVNAEELWSRELLLRCF